MNEAMAGVQPQPPKLDRLLRNSRSGMERPLELIEVDGLDEMQVEAGVVCFANILGLAIARQRDQAERQLQRPARNVSLFV